MGRPIPSSGDGGNRGAAAITFRSGPGRESVAPLLAPGGERGGHGASAGLAQAIMVAQMLAAERESVHPLYQNRRRSRRRETLGQVVAAPPHQTKR